MGEQRKGGREEEYVQSSLEFRPKLYEWSGQIGDMIDLENMCVLYMDVVHINAKGIL